MVKIRSYQDLVVWQTGMDLIAESYRVCRSLPRQEAYGFASQIQRASVSIAANIAEGHARSHRGDYLRSLSIANGSLKELETLFLSLVRAGVIDRQVVTPALRLCDAEGRMLASLIRRLREGSRSHSPNPQPLPPNPAVS